MELHHFREELPYAEVERGAPIYQGIETTLLPVYSTVIKSGESHASVLYDLSNPPLPPSPPPRNPGCLVPRGATRNPGYIDIDIDIDIDNDNNYENANELNDTDESDDSPN